ncbi:MAG: elongation factor P hydroxylase [Marinobacter psychrophilus]|jgi:elongation factor P hydroxylase
MMHCANDIIMLFNGLFGQPCQTVLVRGDNEPEYLPAGPGPAQVIFAHGYFSSALHEISHWCIAGEYRRTLQDYGYWYCPDGRSREQQFAFEQVEVKPQALEWLFALACDGRFHISVDNLAGQGAADQQLFASRVAYQAIAYLAPDAADAGASGFENRPLSGFNSSIPCRAANFLHALMRFYGTEGSLTEALQKDARRVAPLWAAVGSDSRNTKDTETV